MLLCLASCASEDGGPPEPCEGAVRLGAEGYVVEPGERYVCFAFRSPFAPGDLATSWHPVIGGSGALHHWLLFRTATPTPEGATVDCRVPADAQLLMAWSPGGEPHHLPPDVGLEMSRGGDEWLVLQVHYLNASGAPATDDSGVDVCLSDRPLEHAAGVWILGSSAFRIPPRTEGFEVTSSCAHRSELPVHVVAASPHMHSLGRALRTEVARGGADAPTEMLLEVEDFDYDFQTTYRVEPAVRLERDDRLTTTCTFDNPSPEEVGYGLSVEDEMCFDYLIAYPVGALPGHRVCY